MKSNKNWNENFSHTLRSCPAVLELAPVAPLAPLSHLPHYMVDSINNCVTRVYWLEERVVLIQQIQRVQMDKITKF